MRELLSWQAIRDSRFFLYFFLLLVIPAGVVFAEEDKTVPQDPCAGASALFSLIDRPTISDSACSVPVGRTILEMGFQHTVLRGQAGRVDIFPQAEVRFGLPGRNELFFLLPDYNRQRAHDLAERTSEGLSAFSFGLKHEIGYTRKWLAAFEASIIIPSGGSDFGSDGLGGTFNGIIEYSLGKQFAFDIQLGLSSETSPASTGGKRFESFNSNIVATWQPSGRLQFYGEVYGKSSTGPGEGAGYNFDGGIQYLITRFWEIDVERGIRLTGNLSGLNNYIGAGMAFLF